MKIIEVDEELYQYIAGQTQSIGESASDILRRLLHFSSVKSAVKTEQVFAPETFIAPQQNENVEPVQEMRMQAASEAPKVTTKKQSDEAIGKIVEKVRALIHSADFQQESKAVVRFLAILRVLYRTNPESFAQATESLQGRTRVYFARDEATLLMAGNHTKPKQIPDTPYWVITNTNSGRKMLMLEGAMQSMHLPDDLIEEVRAFFTAN
ncbi:replication initiation negative regulator SeqA [Caviibacterium pharyngocola]|uniref:Negative modulator of initiation of replication n=1 Tax=Caviibacterium pharyngocola TaxID=28159 RepID=A0A2M8RTL2_9PAST|nr:replication initiation negative regulator SeqA [Caviibacterium pharyngocola]PJG82236.1 replication initiation negative regulator SeqA [Caviibacterium pharyngocola]